MLRAPIASDPPPATDGDNGFRGFATRRQSATLDAGMLAASVNLRLDRLTARTRAGITPISTDVHVGSPALLLDFALGKELALTTLTAAGTTCTATTPAAHGWTTGTTVEIRGASPADYNGLFGITATGTTTFTYTALAAPASSPATGAPIQAATGPIVADIYDDLVHASALYATNDTARTEYLILASTARAFAIRSGVATQQLEYPAGETVEADDDASLLYWNGALTLFRGYQQAAPVRLATLTQASGTATATTTTGHGLTTGQWVFVQDVTPLGYAGIVQATATGATTFTYAVAAALAASATLDAAGSTVRRCKRPLEWRGDFAAPFLPVPTGALSTTTGTLIHLPPVPWGADVGAQGGGRLAVAFKPDQLLISDPYDGASLDLQYNEFRLRFGSFDRIVAAHAAQQNVVFVLGRRSLHRVLLGDLAIAAAEEITRDVGCAARRTVRQWGDQIVWVGERAIHRVRVTGELSLLPERIPLSNDIQDLLEGANWAAIGRATAIIWANRYYLALPLAGETTNRLVLIYNFINDAWETRDIYPAGFEVEAWHIMDLSGEKRLMASTTLGLVYLMEEAATDTFGSALLQTASPIIASGTTRLYGAGNRAVKRLRRVHAHADLAAGGTLTLLPTTQNPDMSGEQITITEAAAEDGRYTAYAGLQGSGARLDFTLTAAGELRAVEAEFSGLRERGYGHQR